MTVFFFRRMTMSCIKEECGVFGVYNKAGIKQLGNLV